MYFKKNLGRGIALSLLLGGFALVPNVYFEPSTIAYAAVQSYQGTAEEDGCSLEWQYVAKLRARDKAIQQAGIQAGDTLKNYAQQKAVTLTDEEISTIVTDTYQLTNTPVYERMDNDTANLWKADVKIAVDNEEVTGWLHRDNRYVFVERNQALNKAVAQNERQVEALRERAKNTTSKVEINKLKKEFGQVDKDFLANQSLAESNRMLFEGKYDKAIKAANEAITLSPRNSYQAYINRGIAYDGKNELKKAIADYNFAIQLKPYDADSYFYRGRSFYGEKKYKRAIYDYDRVIRLRPNDPEAYNYRGEIYFTVGDYNRAIADYSRAIQLNPNDIVAYSYRGTAYVKENLKEKAVADFEKVLALDSDNAYAKKMLEQLQVTNEQ